ncbi:prenyltransferase [Limosilactobacillus fermentum]|uniref:prenyltransferase n=1 Tax=Limosilactobacillus fermentum TaxID=1613 RepID=UPI002026BC34|nr:prenyltransferase [Limosilactobacillus fermentum]URL82346.1 prenyltransferase [Limosilactobacillus fermentum]
MSVKVFLELVEIKAKTASVLPFILGLFLAAYHYHTVQPMLALLFFIAMFLFNMAVDMLDNYHDYVHAVDTEDYQQNTNIIGRENLSPHLVLAMLITLVVIAALLGIYLVTQLGLTLLWLGVFCFAVGFLYSSGPFPLSGLPVGEFFSGFTMGFMITLISVFVNTGADFTWSWTNLGVIFLVALPDELWISNLLLANNICDEQEDNDNHRHTIVHFIGKKWALYAFAVKNTIAFLAIIAAAVLRLTPWTVLLTLLSIPFVVKQTKLLFNKQVKKETFPAAIRILLIGSFVQVVTFAVGLI